MERIVAEQLKEHLCTCSLLPSVQSTFCHAHSTGTWVLKVVSDIIDAIDSQKVTLIGLQRSCRHHLWLKTRASYRFRKFVILVSFSMVSLQWNHTLWLSCKTAFSSTVSRTPFGGHWLLMLDKHYPLHLLQVVMTTATSSCTEPQCKSLDDSRWWWMLLLVWWPVVAGWATNLLNIH